MGAHQNIIEINGKKYDAITGELVHNLPVHANPVQHAPVAPKPVANGVSMDGFSRRQPLRAPTTNARITSQHTAILHTKKVLRPEPQKSQTLIRSAVKKPTQSLSTSKPAHAQKVPAAQILGHSERRDRLSTSVAKSNLVHKYTSPFKSKIVKQVAPLEVKQPPAHHTNHPVTAVEKPQEIKKNKANHLIEAALANATGHLEHKHSSPKKRRLHHKMGVSGKTMSISSAVLAFVILGGFYAYLNVPNFAMRVAATRAGFSASMPGYKPAGFSFSGPINYSSGQVTVSFKSNTDDRNYNLTQRSSNWTSESLLTNYVVAQNRQYQTLQEKGRTLYIYDGANATWVDNGIWYQIEGDSRMTTDQLSRIATSL